MQSSKHYDRPKIKTIPLLLVVVV